MFYIDVHLLFSKNRIMGKLTTRILFLSVLNKTIFIKKLIIIETKKIKNSYNLIQNIFNV